jgi:hypothetical protein
MVICQHCAGNKMTYGIHINLSGAVTVIARCDTCGKNPDSGKPFYSKKDFDITKLPILIDDRPDSIPCAVCGARKGSQEHHWAPVHLFGLDADKWPKNYLCTEHHREWHAKVTPNMTKRQAKNDNKS